MEEETPNANLERVRRERDLYRRLLALAGADAVEPLLERALSSLADVADAEQVYVEIRAPEDGGPVFSLSRGCTDAEVDHVRQVVSRGIVARALETGETVVTASAELDPRFSMSESVRRNRIASVLCAPVGHAPPLGVVYLQGRRSGGAFTDEDRDSVELLASVLAEHAGRLLGEPDTEDATAAPRERFPAAGLVGRSAALARVLAEASRVAPLDVDVLLTGPSGTGKTVLAREIHRASRRAAGPIREVNCAALPQELLESELFGVEPGAHSTAHRAREGVVRAADGGSLLLDEVTELPPPAQAKLLHLLQEREFLPLGADTPVRVDVRILAASNRDLRQAIAEGRLREDLYYRLCVVPLRLPSLAERREDIAPLAEHLARAACRKHGFPAVALTREAIRAMESAEWPGNVRELANVVQRAIIGAAGEGRARVRRSDVFPDETAAADGAPRPATYSAALRRFQSDLVHDRLAEHAWNVADAAESLGISRSHLYGLMDTLGIRRSSEDGD